MRHIERFPTLEMALNESLRVEDLKKLILLTGITPTSGRKADLVAVIKSYLGGKNLLTVWKKLGELEKAAVAEVVYSSSNDHDGFKFFSKYGKDPNWGTFDKWDQIIEPSTLCLFFYRGMMPDDLKARLKEFVPPPQKAKIKTLNELPEIYESPYEQDNWKTGKTDTLFDKLPLTIHETEITAQRELNAMLRLVDAGKVTVSAKTSRPSGATIKAIASILEGVDFYPPLPITDKWTDENSGPIRAFAWPMLIQAGGLAERAGEKLQLTSAGRKALSYPPGETLRALWNKWVSTTLLDELSRIDAIKGQTGKAKRSLTAVPLRRKAVKQALSQCPVDSWLLIDDFYMFIFALDIPYKVTRDAGGLYIAELQYGSLGYSGGLLLVEQRYLACLLLEYAATLGLIDIALTPPAGARRDYHRMWGTDDMTFLSRYDGLMFFRINSLGAFCLGITKAFKPKPVVQQAVIRVQASMEIVAMNDGLTSGDRLALDAYAVKTSDFTWRLDQEKLFIALDEGRSISEIREFLIAKSENDLPHTVIQLLADISEKSTQLHERGLVILIECADPCLAALILNDSRTNKFCLPAGERHLVVPTSSEAAFKRALRKLGYLIAPNN